MPSEHNPATQVGQPQSKHRLAIWSLRQTMPEEAAERAVAADSNKMAGRRSPEWFDPWPNSSLPGSTHLEFTPLHPPLLRASSTGGGINERSIPQVPGRHSGSSSRIAFGHSIHLRCSGLLSKLAPFH